jgi:hypothetical protein
MDLSKVLKIVTPLYFVPAAPTMEASLTAPEPAASFAITDSSPQAVDFVSNLEVAPQAFDPALTGSDTRAAPSTEEAFADW